MLFGHIEQRSTVPLEFEILLLMHVQVGLEGFQSPSQSCVLKS